MYIQIIIFQTSPESPEAFVLFQKLFKGQPFDEIKSLAAESGLSEEEFQVKPQYNMTPK